ncbi:MAG: hypothetical protein A2046_10175 [Bacteroidetes bacterium GWA2_30_7]|nr:MAG: hypothetical protein A2046_10175 [Bacteroidetes bacterium GWA2_30_7]
MKNKIFLLILISCFAYSVFSQEWTVPDDKKKLTAPFKFDSEHQKKGEEIFNKTCVSCHGHPGQGDFAKLTPVPKDPASNEYQANTDGELFFKISEGRIIMPSFKNTLKAVDIWDLIAYVRTYNKDYVQVFTETATETSITSKISSKITFAEEDKKLKVRIINKDAEKTASEGVTLSIYAKRYFGWLQLDKTKKTDQNGFVSFSLPNDLPGDSIGNLQITLKITDDSGFEETIADTIFKAGVPIIYNNLLDNRAMWNIRSKAPLWLILTYSGTVLTVMSVILYIIWILAQIRKKGSSEI